SCTTSCSAPPGSHPPRLSPHRHHEHRAPPITTRAWAECLREHFLRCEYSPSSVRPDLPDPHNTQHRPDNPPDITLMINPEVTVALCKHCALDLHPLSLPDVRNVVRICVLFRDMRACLSLGSGYGDRKRASRAAAGTTPRPICGAPTARTARSRTRRSR